MLSLLFIVLSIHALAGRATYILAVGCSRYKISIHALAGKATGNTITLTSAVDDFNPRPHKEGDCWAIQTLNLSDISIHALAERATAMRTSQYLYVRIGFTSSRSVVHLLVCHARLRNVPLYSYSDFLRNKNEHCLSLDSFL